MALFYPQHHLPLHLQLRITLPPSHTELIISPLQVLARTPLSYTLSSLVTVLLPLSLTQYHGNLLATSLARLFIVSSPQYIYYFLYQRNNSFLISVRNKWEQSFLVALYHKFLLNFQYSHPAVPYEGAILNKALLLTLQLNRESVNILSTNDAVNRSERLQVKMMMLAGKMIVITSIIIMETVVESWSLGPIY